MRDRRYLEAEAILDSIYRSRVVAFGAEDADTLDVLGRSVVRIISDLNNLLIFTSPFFQPVDVEMDSSEVQRSRSCRRQAGLRRQHPFETQQVCRDWERGTFLSNCFLFPFCIYLTVTPCLLRLDGTRSLQFIIRFLNSNRRRQRKFSQFLARAFMVFKERLGNDHALTRQARASLEATVARQYEEASADLREVGWVTFCTRWWGGSKPLAMT